MTIRRHQSPSIARWILLAGAALGVLGAANVPDHAAATNLPVATNPAVPTSAEAVLPPAPMPAPAPAPAWSRKAVRELIATIEESDAEGLRPADYNLDALKDASAGEPGAVLDALAERSALILAHDYQYGRVGDRSEFGWHIGRNSGGMDPTVLDGAVKRGEVRRYLESLLPTDDRYVALKAALADAPDGQVRDRIRANMERWRWMPRSLGADYLYVNVPSYRLERISGGSVVSSYTVVVGAKDTPTPWIAGDAPSIVVNPWWYVPRSIIKSSNLRPGRGGYVWKASADGGWTAKQAPGPRNALGRLKINLTNDQAIYLHDTPAKGGFAKDDRALSHGCIRVKDIAQLAGELMSDGGDPVRLDDALAQSETRTLDLPKRWPVYLVYFTMDRGEDGAMVSYGDPYGRDAQVIARLDGRPAPQERPALQVASN